MVRIDSFKKTKEQRARSHLRTHRAYLIARRVSCYFTMINRVALIGQLQQEETLEKLLALVQPAPFACDRLVSHLYQSRRESYRRTCETAGKSDKQIERCVISTFQVTESMGFKGDVRQWEDLPRVGGLAFRRPHAHHARFVWRARHHGVTQSVPARPLKAWSGKGSNLNRRAIAARCSAV